MSDIVKLVKLHFSSVLALKKEVGFIFIFSLFMLFVEPTMVAFSGAMLIMATCYSPMAYEEKSKCSYMFHYLPIDSKKYVLSKYIYIILMTIIAMVIASIEYFVMIALGRGESGMLISILSAMILIGVFFMAIVVPVAMIFGFQRGRIAIVILSVVPICFASSIVDFITKVNMNENILAIFITLIGITLVLTSYFITSNMYSRRDVA